MRPEPERNSTEWDCLLSFAGRASSRGIFHAVILLQDMFPLPLSHPPSLNPLTSTQTVRDKINALR